MISEGWMGIDYDCDTIVNCDKCVCIVTYGYRGVDEGELPCMSNRVRVGEIHNTVMLC